MMSKSQAVFLPTYVRVPVGSFFGMAKSGSYLYAIKMFRWPSLRLSSSPEITSHNLGDVPLRHFNFSTYSFSSHGYY